MDIKDKIKRIKMYRVSKGRYFLINFFEKCDKFTYKGIDYYIFDNKVLFKVHNYVLFCHNDIVWKYIMYHQSDSYSKYKIEMLYIFQIHCGKDYRSLCLLRSESIHDKVLRIYKFKKFFKWI